MFTKNELELIYLCVDEYFELPHTYELTCELGNLMYKILQVIEETKREKGE